MKIGEFEVVGELGRGGAGVVYRARAADGREVALKLLLQAGADRQHRLGREAQALAALRHPGIVPLLAEGEHQGRPYLVTELVPGESLQARVDRAGSLPMRSAALIARDLARALAHAHANGVLHRDVKPDNVLLAPDGTARLVDFGLARALTGGSLTQSGQLLGTPGFWSPEQARGDRALTEATDVYGLGATFYAALTGRAPIEGGSWHEVLVHTQSTKPERPSRHCRGLDPALEELCLSCLAKAAEERPPLAQVEQALTAWLDGPRRRKRASSHVVPAVVVVVTTLALAGGGGWWWSTRPVVAPPAPPAPPREVAPPPPVATEPPTPEPEQVAPIEPPIDPAPDPRAEARQASLRLYDEAVRLMTANDGAAIARAEEATRVAPFNGLAWGVLASALNHFGRPAEALVALERAYAAEEPAPASQFDALHGFILRALRRNEEAIVFLGRAYAATDRPDPMLAFAYGCSLRETHRPVEAVEPLAYAARGGQMGWQAEFNLGGALRAASRHEEGAAAYKRARACPNYQGYYAHLREAETYIDLLRPADGLKLLLEVTSSPSGPTAMKSPEFLAALAVARVRTGSPEDALDFARRVIDGPGGTKYDRAYEARVEALLALERIDEARAAVADGLVVFPGHAFFVEHAQKLEQR